MRIASWLAATVFACVALLNIRPAVVAAQTATSADQQLFETVDQLLREKKLQDALDALNKAIAGGGSATAFALRCQVNDLTGHYDDARNDCAKALQLDPKLPFAQRMQGDLLYDVGDIPGSLRYYDAYIALAPDAGGYWRRCDARRRTDDWVGAQADCDKAYQLAPDEPSIRLSRGRIELHNNRLQQAYQDFDVAYNSSGDAIPLYWRGYTALQMKAYDKAVADFTTAISKGDSSPDTYSNRAMAYVGLGKKDLAKADFEKAIALDQAHGLCKEAEDLAIQEVVSLGSPQTVGLDPSCVLIKHE